MKVWLPYTMFKNNSIIFFNTSTIEAFIPFLTLEYGEANDVDIQLRISNARNAKIYGLEREIRVLCDLTFDGWVINREDRINVAPIHAGSFELVNVFAVVSMDIINNRTLQPRFRHFITE